MLSNDTIVDIVKKHASPKQAVIALVDAAMKNGGKDNITVTIIKVK